MKVLIAGATGFIGRALVRKLVDEGRAVFALTRNPRRAGRVLPEAVTPILWDGQAIPDTPAVLNGLDVVINLAGENIGTGLWTSAKKERIRNSRLFAPRALLSALQQLPNPPRVFVHASAIGYYGNRGDEILTEQSSRGSGFLAEVIAASEKVLAETEIPGVSKLILRSGFVMGPGSLALNLMTLPYRFFLGAVPGDGRGWFSWIHIEDEVRAILFLIENHSAGIFNLTSPQPLRMEAFCRTLGRVLKRPTLFHIPKFLMKAGLGQMAEETLLTSQRVLPQRLLQEGFQFHFEDAEAALRDILR